MRHPSALPVNLVPRSPTVRRKGTVEARVTLGTRLVAGKWPTTEALEEDRRTYRNRLEGGRLILGRYIQVRL